MHPSAVHSYQQALGAIGEYLDRRACSDLLLCSLEDGYVARVERRPGPPEALTFPLDEVVALIRARDGRETPPLPSGRGETTSLILRTLGGYAAFLDALGQECDRLEATSMLVLELHDAVLISYQRAPSSRETWQAGTREYLYDEAGLRQLVEAAGRAAVP